MTRYTQFQGTCEECNKDIQRTVESKTVADNNEPVRIRCNACENINPVDERVLL